MGSRQVRLRSLQHRSGDDDLCNVVVPWVGQVGPQVLKGTSSGVGDGLDAETQEGDKCKTSYSHMIPHKCQHYSFKCHSIETNMSFPVSMFKHFQRIIT